MAITPIDSGVRLLQGYMTGKLKPLLLLVETTTAVGAAIAVSVQPTTSRSRVTGVGTWRTS